MKLTTENPTTEQAAETRVYGKITRRLIPFLILCYFFAYLDRVNVGFAKLHMQDVSVPAFSSSAILFLSCQATC